MTKVTIIGGATGREHAFAKSFAEKGYDVSAVLWAHNPFVEMLCSNYSIVNLNDVKSVFQHVQRISPDYVLVGQGEVTQRGIRDLLDEENIPCIAPTKDMAKIEGSKSFFRDLLLDLDSTLVPRYGSFTSYGEELEQFVRDIDNGKIVVKCDATISGPRVRIHDSISGLEHVLDNARDWINRHGKIVVEEFIEGHEIAVMSFTDGEHLIHSPPFRNHKRIYDDDRGENTSGMGTITTGEILPVMTQGSLRKLHRITEMLLGWLKDNYSERYLGSLYGEFLVKNDDVKVIEYNCRFGNPSTMNLVALMDGRFPDVCEAIVNGGIPALGTIWKQECSLSAYVVPLGYPYSDKNVGMPVDISRLNPESFFCGNLDFSQASPLLKRSRGFAVCKTGKNIDKVRDSVYAELAKVKGPILYRKDIGLIY